MGINDILKSDLPVTTIVENYRKILGRIPSSVKVVVSAVFPVDQNVRKVEVNHKVHLLNKALCRICSRAGNRYFSPTPTALVGADGNLDKMYHNGDGIHLNASGYAIWIDRLKEVLSRTEKTAGVGK